MITSDQSIEYPFIDFYIRYNSKGGYASHPYPLQQRSNRYHYFLSAATDCGGLGLPDQPALAVSE